MLKKKSFRLQTLPASIAAAIFCSSLLLAGCSGDDGDDGVDGVDGQDGVDGVDGITNFIPLGLKRLATAPLGAEFTGMYLNSDNTLFLNVQHPSSSNTTADAAGKVFDKG
ncbi:MAG: hypothetical protein B6D82_10380, partial [gamma proteobacterium symbiont of Ctena orbiculata]